MVIKSTNATTETSDVSTMESLDVLPPKPKTPISHLFSFCTPKKQPMEDEDDVSDETDETDEITGRSLTFEPEHLEESIVKKEEEAREATLFDGGLLFQIGVVSAVLAFETLV
ncbi:unnamed protein product [Cylindrotheca closterium]|uniref:Uncharacterized protein n=1 Tax=Cylindrotheca closterium TaxID=2856 RepID=A0AAD2FRJ7_9STRA|nr:unnamed protein product [Cylindrotheca closterium]